MTHLVSGGISAAQRATTELTTSIRQEVVPVEIYMNKLPVTLPAVQAPMSAVRVYRAAEVFSAMQGHQVQAQSELLLASAPAGNKGTTGFMVEGIRVSNKRTDVRGVPPRGRPV